MREHFEVHNNTCPLCGCRAVDLATGGANSFIAELNTITDADVNGMLPAGLEAADRAELLDGWRANKQFMQAEWQIRMAPWMLLPLRALGMAHEDMNIVVEVLVDCLMQFEALAQPQLAHP